MAVAEISERELQRLLLVTLLKVEVLAVAAGLRRLRSASGEDGGELMALRREDWKTAGMLVRLLAALRPGEAAVGWNAASCCDGGEPGESELLSESRGGVEDEDGLVWRKS